MGLTGVSNNTTSDRHKPNTNTDGDGFTNRAEYTYFTPDLCVADTAKGQKGNDPLTGYPSAALNYRICPDCDGHCSACTDPHGGFYEAGTEACLRVPGDFPAGTPFDWAKEGQGPLFGDRYEGADGQQIGVYGLAAADSGTYVCTYGDEADTYRIAITVVESLPAVSAGWLAACLVALVAGVAAYSLHTRAKA